jgi:hypothetical protein
MAALCQLSSLNSFMRGMCYLCAWQQCWIHIPVLPVKLRMSLVVFVQFWWRNIERPPPDLHLFLSVLFNSFKLVQPLQRPIVPFIKFPTLYHWNVMTIELIGRIVKSLNGPCQDRGVTNIKLKSILLKRLTSLHCLLNAYQ